MLPGRGLRQGDNFWLRLTTASGAQCLRLSERFFFHLFFLFNCLPYLVNKDEYYKIKGADLFNDGSVIMNYSNNKNISQYKYSCDIGGKQFKQSAVS